jgi:hypothetical protein
MGYAKQEQGENRVIKMYLTQKMRMLKANIRRMQKTNHQLKKEKTKRTDRRKTSFWRRYDRITGERSY